MAERIQTCFKRCEKKYFVTPEQQRFLTDGMKPYMEADRYDKYTICSIYYDTADWRLIRASIEKPVYKEKLRIRSYGVPAPGDKVFVELKKKYDGVVYKRRITTELDKAEGFLTAAIPGDEFGQIGREIEWVQSFYAAGPKVFIGYDRQALAGKDDPELRVTFDTNLRWRSEALDLRAGDHGAPLLSPERILMEIKIPGVCPLWMSRLLSEAGVFPCSYSKYGACYQKHLIFGISNNDIRKKELNCA